MPRLEVPISNGFYVLPSLPIANQECINWIPVLSEFPSLSQRQLLGSAGIQLITDTGGGVADVNRGFHVKNNIPYFVNGTLFYRLDRSVSPEGVETFTSTPLGTVSGSTRVSMADNGTQLMILVPGGSGYIYDEDDIGSEFQEITDPDFLANGNPQIVVFIDGYFACSTDTKKWIISNLNNGLAWDALDFGSAESDPDTIVAPVVHNNQIFILGSETTEGFQNIGGAGFPFQRNNIFLDKGCYAPFSLISTNQQFFMIGGGKNEKAAIWSYQGGGYRKISTRVIDSVLHDYSQAVLNSAFSMAWASKGQFYVAFVFIDRAFVYNMTTGLWHEQKSGIPDEETNDIDQTRWRVNSLVTGYGYTLVGDAIDGRIGILDEDIYQEYENDIIRVFSCQPLSNLGQRIRLPWIELTMESGVGDNEVIEPQVSLAISEDAKVFGYERNRSMGKVGEYWKRAIWRKNGRVPRFAILKFRMSDPVKPVVIKLEVDAT